MPVLVAAALGGCSPPPAPPELEVARRQEIELELARADRLSPDKYTAYTARLKKAREGFVAEQDRFVLFRDYEPVRLELNEAIAFGREVLADARQADRKAAELAGSRISSEEASLDGIDEFSRAINARASIGAHMVRARLALAEARALAGRGDYDAASKAAGRAEKSQLAACGRLRSALGRYADSAQLRKWKAQVSDTIEVSRAEGAYAIVVVKLERVLELYRGGRLIRKFRIGLGRNGSDDKLHAGDNATPEGHYRVVRKNSESRYHKALLIDYPNGEDLARYRRARADGLVPSGRGIGGLVEIHGGGGTSVTRGCIAMDDEDIDYLFALVPVGTPVTIVGATELEEALASLVECGG